MLVGVATAVTAVTVNPAQSGLVERERAGGARLPLVGLGRPLAVLAPAIQAATTRAWARAAHHPALVREAPTRVSPEEKPGPLEMAVKSLVACPEPVALVALVA
jgi:hypothetical protein